MYPAWNRTFLDLQQHVDEVFEELIYRRALRPSQADWRPPVDIHEMPEEFLLEIDLPAVAPELVRIMANERQLTIKGERCMSAVKGAIYARCERHGGEFCRCVDLPRPVDPEKAQAEYRHGTICIRLPKKAETQDLSLRTYTEVRVMIH